ncbi:MAG TPA: proton-conducting transporter membrane subunit [Xanthobacteraceae bacterium]
MTVSAALLPAAVLLPLGMATLLLALAHWLPPRLSNLVAIATALALAAICAILARAALDGPILHWFGGWTPGFSTKPGIVLGVSFAADPASATVSAFAALLFAVSFTFAWGYFDEVHSHFQVLMLLFLAAITGFCLTHDVFNLFVWFELMSVAAFALTAYPLGKSSLEGAFNFTITNALGSFFMLAGVGLLYARTGTLDFAQMGRTVAAIGSDPVLTGGFCLIAAALLTKAAIVPFHMWLSDAHAVAPSPVSVIFSGIMVSVALFALAKLIAQVFVHDPDVLRLAQSGLPWMGTATAIIGGAMAWAQRHLKRLLAFSTIAHLGIMLIGFAAVTPSGTAGFLLYLLGHGLVKGALFMIAGILLALRASADEIVLYKKGRDLWPAGVAMAVGGFLLGGFPFGLMHDATDLIGRAAPVTDFAITAATALTGGAVVRAALRIFAGVSGAPGVERTEPTEREREKDDRPLWLMLAPCGALLAIALIPGHILTPFIREASARLIEAGGESIAQAPVGQNPLLSYAPIALTAALVILVLARRRPTTTFARRLFAMEAFPFRALSFLHSGVVGDYVSWMILGIAALALAVG